MHSAVEQRDLFLAQLSHAWALPVLAAAVGLGLAIQGCARFRQRAWESSRPFPEPLAAAVRALLIALLSVCVTAGFLAVTHWGCAGLTARSE
jgi:energy-converting hydrogenase Eha subunit A